jgi:Leucine-rich repeat (LRR) protein
MLSGEIPFEIGNLSSIKSLNLSSNFFTGRIPATIANMSAIESLDLSRNDEWKNTRELNAVMVIGGIFSGI